MAYGIYRISQYIPGLRNLQVPRYTVFGNLLEKHCVPWKVIPAVAAFISFVFWYISEDIPWVLWKQLLMDYLLIIAVPLYMAIFADRISDIWEYSLYESKNLENDITTVANDIYLHVWDDVKYYPFLKEIKLQHCSFGCDTLGVLKELQKFTSDQKKDEVAPE